MSPCPRAGRWFRGCRFEARYDEVPSGLRADDVTMNAKQLKAFFFRRIYVRDVCTRCGATIERTRGHD